MVYSVEQLQSLRVEEQQCSPFTVLILVRSSREYEISMRAVATVCPEKCSSVHNWKRETV